MLLGRNARISAGNVDEADERKTVPLRELHQTHRLSIALGIRHAEVALAAFLDVAALLVTHERDRASLEPAEADHQRVVVGAAAITVQFDPVVQEAADVVQRVWTVLVPRELDGAPDLLVGRRRLDALELTLQLLELARDARAAKQVEVAQARQPLSQPQLVVSRHSRKRAAGVARRTASARAGGRSHRCDRSGGSALQARSPPAASRASSAARRVGR